MTYNELLEELKAAKTTEDQADIVLAVTTEAYDDGYEAGVASQSVSVAQLTARGHL